MNLNEVKLIGNLTRPPELTYLPSGTAVAETAIALNDRYVTKTGENKEITTFIDLKVFGPSAENLAKLAQKGTHLFIEGTLRQDRWEDKQTNEPRSKLYVNAKRWQFTQFLARTEAPVQGTSEEGPHEPQASINEAKKKLIEKQVAEQQHSRGQTLRV
jgi:single stranded DNA-binding protein